MSESVANTPRQRGVLHYPDAERLVDVGPYRPTAYARIGAPPTAAEVGRKTLALRGWRRVLAQLAGLPVDSAK